MKIIKLLQKNCDFAGIDGVITPQAKQIVQLIQQNRIKEATARFCKLVDVIEQKYGDKLFARNKRFLVKVAKYVESRKTDNKFCDVRQIIPHLIRTSVIALIYSAIVSGALLASKNAHYIAAIICEIQVVDDAFDRNVLCVPAIIDGLAIKSDKAGIPRLIVTMLYASGVIKDPEFAKQALQIATIVRNVIKIYQGKFKEQISK